MYIGSRPLLVYTESFPFYKTVKDTEQGPGGGHSSPTPLQTDRQTDRQTLL